MRIKRSVRRALMWATVIYLIFGVGLAMVNSWYDPINWDHVLQYDIGVS